MVPELAAKIGAVDTPMLYFALGLLLIGFVFKIGAVPFHFWAPDVYEGAPTSVTGYMACIVKASAIAATMRVLWGIFPGLFDVWVGFVWMVALLTMIVGNLLALRQQSVKRMLAYSSIAHAGYLMVGFLAPGGEYGGGAAMLFYLISYTAMTLGAFGVVLAVSGKYAGKRGADDLMTFNGLGYTNPFLAVVMSLFMLGLAGLPPSLAGLVGKVYLFSAAVKAGFLGIAIVGMIASCISCYYYLRVIVAMYFKEPVASESEAASREDTALAGVLGLCAVAVVVLGISPSYVYDLARSVMLSF